MAARDLTPLAGRLLTIMNKILGIRLLIGIAAHVSVVPPSRTDRHPKSRGQPLRAANSSTIATYGLRSLSIDFELRRTFRRIFVIADVVHPIIE